MRGDFPSSKQDQFVLRFPDGLRDRIKVYAARHGRSMNAEIVRVLEKDFPEPLTTLNDVVIDLLDALQDCISYRNWQIAEGGVVPEGLRDTWKRAEAAIAKAVAQP